ncbi:MAG: glycosyltransferase family 87 protein [Gemmatimonadaceae bacterium]
MTIAAVPLPRLRRILLALYLLTAFADAAGKWLATNETVNRAAARLLHGSAAVAPLERARRPMGNFEIFRAASRHLLSGDDLYAEYPAELQDRYKYSPTFAVLFAPFAWLPSPLALFLWNALNAVTLYVAVEWALSARQALVANAFLLPEVLRAMQNAQSNALVAGLIILAFVYLERRHVWRAAAAVVLGACVKIFPLAALSFALPRRRVVRIGIAVAVWGVVLAALPLLLTSPDTLIAQYHSWRGVESLDAQQRWFSVMELLHRWLGADWPNWPVQLTGTLILLAPLALRRDRWDDYRFRLLYVCSVLLYVVLFNHQAERASYVIAFAGAAMWFASEPRARWRTALFAVAFITIPLMSTVIPVPAIMKSRTAMLYRLAVPCLAIWIAVQWELWKRRGSRQASGDEGLHDRDESSGRTEYLVPGTKY